MGSELFLVVNPAARHGAPARRWPEIARALKEAGLPFEAAFTGGPGDATRLAAEALRGGGRTVVAVGGDGTANEVANGFFVGKDDDGALIDPTAGFGFIPTGTGTDLARCLGYPRHDLGAALSALGPNGRMNSMDVGRVRYVNADGQSVQRYFLVGADLGLGGETAALARSTAFWAKNLGGFGAYLVAAALAIARHRPRVVHYAIDDENFVAASTDIIFVANGRYIGGGMLVAPAASLNDGLLDVIILRATRRLDLLCRLLPAVYRGAHLKHSAVRARRARRVRVEAANPLPLQMDGEQPGTSPAEFRVVPRILPIRLPPERR